MVSLKTIAKECGVSTATVSKALNNQKDVSIETKLRIKKVAEAMGYMPNAAAKALKTNRSYNIGVLFEDESVTSCPKAPKLSLSIKVSVPRPAIVSLTYKPVLIAPFSEISLIVSLYSYLLVKTNLLTMHPKKHRQSSVSALQSILLIIFYTVVLFDYLSA